MFYATTNCTQNIFCNTTLDCVRLCENSTLKTSQEKSCADLTCNEILGDE